MQDSVFDVIIFGGGIAGLSLADALLEKGFSVCVIDKSEIGAGASGTPGALVNPATGRRAAKVWKAEACYRAIKSNIKKVLPFADEPFYRQNGVLRPALLKKMARKMRKQYEKTEWPEGWCRWMSEKEIKKLHPGIQCVGGGIWIPVGITVDAGKYMNALAGYLREQGVEIRTGILPKAEPADNFWKVSAGGEKLKTGELIFATGYETTQSSWWKELPLEPVKGELALFEAPEKLLAFDYSISSLGYIARVRDHNRFIQGSTYDHNFNQVCPTEKGLEYLRGRMHRTLPELEKKSRLIKQWAGVRTSTPDHKPLLGRHKKNRNLHVFTGLGSKGLMYGKFLAEHYADHLADNTPLYPSINAERFNNNEK